MSAELVRRLTPPSEITVGHPSLSPEERSTGYLCAHTGPMTSGKSTILLNDLNVLAGASGDKLKILYINSRLDTRSTTAFSSHGCIPILDPRIDTLKVSLLAEAEEQAKSHSVIGIDEAQFYEDLVPVVKHWLKDYHSYIIIASLDGDSHRRVFGHTLELIPECDDYYKHKAFCARCLEEGKWTHAPFTGSHKEIKEQVVIGGMDIYMPLCRLHHDQQVFTS